MRKTIFLLFTITTLVLFICSCTTSKNQTANRIGLVAVNGYTLRNQEISQDTTFILARNESELSNQFTATGTEKLDMYGKTAVAIALKNPAALQFDGADFSGDRIRVYVKTCEAATQPNCLPGKIFLATVPKVGSAKSVQFYINNHLSGQVQL